MDLYIIILCLWYGVSTDLLSNIASWEMGWFQFNKGIPLLI